MIILRPLVMLAIIVTGVKSDFLSSNCDTTSNYTTNSTYKANLDKLQSSLLSSVITSGFSNDTIGQYPDQVFGLALCRGDLSAEGCQTCIQSTFSEVPTDCPYGKNERIWYDECFLHYSNKNFFSTMRYFGYYWCGSQNATDPQQFSTILGQLVNTLVSEAAGSSKMFAAGFVNYTNFNKLYGVALCTRDLSKEDCYQCLQGCVENIPFYCDGRLGGRFYGESCNLRYQLSIFYNTSAVPNAAAPAPEPALAPTVPAVPPPAGKTSKGNDNGGTNVERIAILVVGPAFAAVLISLAVCACFIWTRNKHKPCVNIPDNNEDETMGKTEGSMLFDLSTIRSATNNFSEENKLGEGGFGLVYKGKLVNGQEIAVKRLSGNSHQGLVQLKNEVNLLAKLQHKNLVKLFGCCLDGSEKLLVYEYLSNTSLDNVLFDHAKRPKLNWQMRLKIIEGIARGLLYLHEDSRLKIVHRDLKVSNILLDADMNPKISDFGLAKLFNIDATHANTSRIAGTYGYMAPEYAMGGIFSTRSDVFSFGILVLEILTARPVYCMLGQMEEDILTYVWRNWSQGMPLETVDKSVIGRCPSQELIRCIHIALLCVQEDPSARPDMETVILMLKSQSMSLSTPTAPKFFFRIVVSTTDNQIPVTDSTSMSENAESRIEEYPA